MYDYTIVGAGLTGATLARFLTERGKKVLVLEKDKVGGNCRTEVWNDIEIHVHGPHTWHNSDSEVEEFMRPFGNFNPYFKAKYAVHGDIFYPFPITKSLFQKFNPGVSLSERLKGADESSFTNYLTSVLGHEMFETFYKAYSLRHWGTLDIPVWIAKRIPIRDNENRNYFHDGFSGLPDSYVKMFNRMFKGIEIKKENVNYKTKLNGIVIYTGALDEFFNHSLGMLSYRTLEYDHKKLNMNYFQPCETLNYIDARPYNRTIEHKQFNQMNLILETWVSWEYPRKAEIGDYLYYPMWDYELYERYRKMLPQNVVPAGRLGLYKYLDMNVAVKEALKIGQKIL